MHPAQAPLPHTVESISWPLDYMKGTQVDCLRWCVDEQVAYSWPSKVMESAYELRAKGASDTTGWDSGEDVMYDLHRRRIDYLPLLIERAHDQDLMFVASFRMNDTHIKSYPNSVLSSPFWKTHQHYRLWEATDGKSYYNAALDYSYPEVRDRYRETSQSHKRKASGKTEFIRRNSVFGFAESPSILLSPRTYWDFKTSAR